jgi:hypothetical protein
VGLLVGIPEDEDIGFVGHLGFCHMFDESQDFGSELIFDIVNGFLT